MDRLKNSLKKRIKIWWKKHKGLIIEVKAGEFIQDQLSIIKQLNTRPSSIEEHSWGMCSVTQSVVLKKTDVPDGLVNHRWIANFGKFVIPSKSIALAGEPETVEADIDAIMISEADAIAKRQAAYSSFKKLASGCMRDLKNAQKANDYGQILSVLNRMDQASIEHIRGYVSISFDKVLGMSVFVSFWHIGTYLSECTSLKATKNLGVQLKSAAGKYVFKNRKGEVLAKEIVIEEMLTNTDYAKVKAAK